MSTRPDRIAKGLWWDEALSLLEGCEPCDPQCLNCWSHSATSMRAAQSNPAMQARYSGLSDGKKFNGTVRFMAGDLLKPIRRKTPTVYAIWNDLFFPRLPAKDVKATLDMISRCPRHTFIVLTKRPAIAWQTALFLRGFKGYPPNLIIGTSVGTQQSLEQKIANLFTMKAISPQTRTILSIEPMLGPMDLRNVKLCLPEPLKGPPIHATVDCLTGEILSSGIRWNGMAPIDGVILGGESGPHARPLQHEWVARVRDDCIATGVPFFFKRWDEKYSLDKSKLDGREWRELPW